MLGALRGDVADGRGSRHADGALSHRSRPRVRHWVWGAAIALAVWSVGCAEPSAGIASPPPAAVLYVANGADGTIARLDAASGRPLGPPLPAGPAPWQVAAGDHRGLVVLAGGASPRLTHLVRAGGGWAAHPLRLEAGARGGLLSGDGAYAAAAYHVPAADPTGAARCRLALIDLRAGAIARAFPACAPGDVLRALALEDRPGGPVAYLALWRGPGPAGSGALAGRSRLAAVHAATGAVLAVQPLAGVPAHVVLAPRPDGPGRRLVLVEARGRAEPADTDERQPPDVPSLGRWHLVTLDPETLAPEAEFAVPHYPQGVAVAPDGRHAYWLAGPWTLGVPTPLLRTDLATGATRLEAHVPGPGFGGLAVTAERVYVPNPEGSEVSVLERRTGSLTGRIAVGRRPVGIALGGP